MPRALLPLLLSLSLTCATAHATNLGLSGQFHSSPFHSQPPTLFQIELSEVPTGKGQTRFSVSTHAARLGYRQGLTLPALGAVQGEVRLSHPWSGGLRLSSQLSGSAGPVALGIGGEVFSAAVTAEDPLAAWEEQARDLRPGGWNADLNARYRLSRFLTLHSDSEFGPQPSTLAALEWRRAPREEEDPNTTLLLRGGVRAGRGVLGASVGATYRTGAGLDLSADALLGAQPGLGARLTLPPLGENELSAYARYEPWRRASAPLRYGADLSRPLGRGQLGVSLRGGQFLNGAAGFGAALRYSLPLGSDATP